MHAPGSGLGHLTRALAARHTLEWIGPVVVLTSSTRARDVPLPDGVELLTIPRAVVPHRDALGGWLRTTLARLGPDELWVDAFPAGIRGEIDADLLGAVHRGRPVHHLARLLRWERYRSAIHQPLPAYDSVLAVEPLGAAHERALLDAGCAVTPVQLRDPPPAGTVPVLPRGSWLVVHAGSPAETADLCAHARDLLAARRVDSPLVLVTPDGDARLADLTLTGTVPAWPLFDAAEHVVAAAGCNVVRQLLASTVTFDLVPLERRWDDQFERARRARGSAPETRPGTFPLRP